jgi:hypothetical protein
LLKNNPVYWDENRRHGLRENEIPTKDTKLDQMSSYMELEFDTRSESQFDEGEVSAIWTPGIIINILSHKNENQIKIGVWLSERVKWMRYGIDKKGDDCIYFWRFVGDLADKYPQPTSILEEEVDDNEVEVNDNEVEVNEEYVMTDGNEVVPEMPVGFVQQPPGFVQPPMVNPLPRGVVP